MKWIVVAMGAAFACTGCASLGKDVNNDSRWTPHDIGLAANGPPLTFPARLKERFDRAYLAEAAPGATPNGALRRELFRSLLRESDAKCETYLVGIGAGRTAYDTVFGVGSHALVTAGSLASPERSANLLSALGGFFQSTNETLNNNLFGGEDIQVLAGAVRAGRRTEYEVMMLEVTSGVYDTWDAESIMRQAEAYDQKCGIGYGLDRLREAVGIAEGVQLQAAEEAVEKRLGR